MSWGVGDLADLATLARWSADQGAGFVLVNPLHAAEPVAPIEPSPYLPTTRRFANPAYLRVEDTDEYAAAPAAVRAQVDTIGIAARLLNGEDCLDRDTAWETKRAALELLFAATSRPPEFEAWRAAQGDGLERFATWCALADEHGTASADWPADLDAAEPAAVAAYADANADRLTFHCWLQWQMALQLAAAQRTALQAGMALGVVHDLAVGVHPEGADAWGLRHALATGVSVGAPPDRFNQVGQNWSQPPWHPDRLAELGYAPFRDMVRALLQDAGGLRIDHVIGLFRLWWIPDGMSAVEGAYVRYDHEALIGILVLEAARAGAVVIGEDLGVVEPAARDYLRERGLLGTSILWFEWGEDGRLLAPEDYRRLCLATVTTHDLPPTAGYLDLAHVDLRERLGLLTLSVEEERATELAAIDKVRDALVERGLLAPDAAVEEQVVALHALPAPDAVPHARRRPGRPGGRPAHHQPAGHQRRVPQLAASAHRPRRPAAAAGGGPHRRARAPSRRGHVRARLSPDSRVHGVAMVESCAHLAARRPPEHTTRLPPCRHRDTLARGCRQAAPGEGSPDGGRPGNRPGARQHRPLLGGQQASPQRDRRPGPRRSPRSGQGDHRGGRRRRRLPPDPRGRGLGHGRRLEQARAGPGRLLRRDLAHRRQAALGHRARRDAADDHLVGVVVVPADPRRPARGLQGAAQGALCACARR